MECSPLNQGHKRPRCRTLGLIVFRFGVTIPASEEDGWELCSNTTQTEPFAIQKLYPVAATPTEMG